MFEHHTHALLPRPAFFARLVRSSVIGLAIIVASLVAGMAGYRYFEKMPWVDAFANAAMILSGMGPLGPLETTGGKIFAGCYALYSGLAVIVVTGIIFAPVVHRFLHRFHLEHQGRKDLEAEP